MHIDRMTCPCCGGTIELDDDRDGGCDTCLTFVVAGELIRDPEYTEEEEQE